MSAQELCSVVLITSLWTIGELKGTSHTYRALFEPCLVNAAMFTVAGPWSYFLTSSLYSNEKSTTVLAQIPLNRKLDQIAIPQGSLVIAYSDRFQV